MKRCETCGQPLAAGAADVIRRERHALGWTQAQLAKAAGWTGGKQAKLETGYTTPSLSDAAKLGELFNITLDSFAQRAGLTHGKNT